MSSYLKLYEYNYKYQVCTFCKTNATKINKQESLIRIRADTVLYVSLMFSQQIRVMLLIYFVITEFFTIENNYLDKYYKEYMV